MDVAALTQRFLRQRGHIHAHPPSLRVARPRARAGGG